MDILTKIKDLAIRYGLILGIVSVVLTYAVYVIDYMMMIKWWFGVLAFGVMIVVIIIACKAYRSKNNDLASFKELFFMIMIIMAISVIISTAGNFLLHKVIDTEVGSKLNNAVIDQTVEMMEGFGTPDDVIDKTIADMEEKDNFSTSTMLLNALGAILIGGGLFGLIFAAIFKKNPPEMI